MKANIRNLIKNSRYKLLHIGDNHYLMDMRKSFWGVIFPFLFWIVPSNIYHIDDEETIKQLKAPLSKRQTTSQTLKYGGLGLILSNALSGILDLLEFNTPLWLNISILIIALTSVVVIFIAYNQRNHDKLHDVIQLESLPQSTIRLHPKSFGHVLKVIFAYVFGLTLSVFSYMLYFSIQNVFVLLTASALLFIVLLASQATAQDGTTTVTFK